MCTTPLLSCPPALILYVKTMLLMYLNWQHLFYHPQFSNVTKTLKCYMYYSTHSKAPMTVDNMFYRITRPEPK